MDEEPERVLSCPVCGEALALERKHGIAIDVCAEHGVWLDAGELESVVGVLRRRMQRRSTRAVRSARKKGSIDGALWGWWSLLGD